MNAHTLNNEHRKHTDASTHVHGVHVHRTRMAFEISHSRLEYADVPPFHMFRHFLLDTLKNMPTTVGIFFYENFDRQRFF